MRVKKISICGLFGVFDHEIPLSPEKERVTIIHAPNGYGKTTIFRLLNAVFNHRFAEISKTPFRSMSVEFEDNSALDVSKGDGPDAHGIRTSIQKELDNIPLITFAYSHPKKKKVTYRIPAIDSLSIDGVYSRNALMRELELLQRDLYHRTRKGSPQENAKRLSALRNKQTYLESLLFRHRESMLTEPPFIRHGMPEALETLFSTVAVRFIESQRLLQKRASPSRPREERIPPSRDYDEDDGLTLSVTRYSTTIKEIIETKMSEYASTSQALDRTFPNRLIQELSSQDRPKSIGKKAIEKQLKDLETTRANLAEVGLLDASLTSPPIKEGKIPELTRRVLALYIRDTSDKLAVFRDLANKIDLLKRTVNRQFRFKTLEISRDKGFVFGTNDGTQLSPSQLSSGEQHEIVLNYELLFNTSPGSLVLIDEPEISLHVAWQQQFVNKLMDIAKIADLDVLIATHSPQIVHNHMDLTVELKGE